MPAVDPAVFGNEEGQTTPRQRFRQRRLGMLGGSSEEAVVASAEREALSQISTSSQEERGEEGVEGRAGLGQRIS